MIAEITDSELINELSLRVEDIKKKYSEQEHLMNELKKVNEKLILSEKIKSNFLSNIRNEINNPITSILGLTSALIDSELQSKEINNIASLIYNDMHNLDFQLKNIFLSASIEAGEIIISPTVLKVDNVIKSILDSYKHTILKNNLSIITNIKLEKEFKTDSEYLYSILNNLISNSVRFCEENGTIRIDSYYYENKLCFFITNTIIPNSQIDSEIIFDRFRQMDEGSTKTYLGHGLGLSIVKSLLEYINGKIEVNTSLENEVLFKIIIEEIENTEGISTHSTDGNDFIFMDQNNVLL